VDTSSIILAVSSPPGRSMRGMIRASGTGVFDVVQSMLGDALRRERRAVIARIRLGRFNLPVIVMTMPEPCSYTGEDTVELITVGNPVLLERIIDAIIDAGAAVGRSIRRAEPGEFTARAFFNHRLSLTEAEGVVATIAARSDAELRAAGLLRSGSLGAFASACADDLAGALALVETGIDFTDQDDVVAITPAELHARMEDLCARCNRVLSRAVGFEWLEAIPWVVLVGPPNAGKSTLFNALLGRQRAVVSDVAGTTRDVLAEPLHLATNHGDAEVMLVDIAGLDESLSFDQSSPLNPAMQRAAREAIDRADLILECLPPDGDGAACFSRATMPALRVMTKLDLAGDLDRGERSIHDFAVSARTGEGVEALRRGITARLAERAVSLAADAFALQPRHESALRAARGHLDEAVRFVGSQRENHAIDRPEVAASIMRLALDDLGELAGDITADDVLGRIFATFCIGK